MAAETTAPPPAKQRTRRKAAGASEGVEAHNAAAAATQDGKKAEALSKDQQGDLEGLEALEPGANPTSFVETLGNPLEGVIFDASDIKEEDEEEENWRTKFGHQEARTDLKRWLVGCPPEHGGRESKTFEIYVQAPLGWMGRSRFFSILSAALAKAIKASGGNVGGMADVFGPEGGSLRDRAQALTTRDWGDAASFMALVTELVAYVPDLLGECYCIWLDIPTKDRSWAKQVFEQRWDPDRGLYGLRDEDHEEIIERFIDQNYEELRGFFTRTLPRFAARVAEREKERADRVSTSAPSKPSSTSGRTEEATS
jgi:hypothetical protein